MPIFSFYPLIHHFCVLHLSSSSFCQIYQDLLTIFELSWSNCNFYFYFLPTDPSFWEAWPVKQQINLASPKLFCFWECAFLRVSDYSRERWVHIQISTLSVSGQIPLRQLVYRVHPLPESMKPLVWDFGQLDDVTEELYTREIVNSAVCFLSHFIRCRNSSSFSSKA